MCSLSLFIPENLKNTLMMFGLNIFVYATGYNTINSYAEIILTKSEVSISPSIVVMVLGFSTIVVGSSVTLVMDRFGRRNLLIVSSFGTAVSLIVLGLHFYLLSLRLDPEMLTWLPITSLLFFNIFVSYGLVQVPSTLLSEIFPAKLKNMASLCIALGNALLGFTFTKTYQPFIDVTGETIFYWSYGLFVLLAVPYVWYFVPETTGKSLLEIQQTTKQ